MLIVAEGNAGTDPSTALALAGTPATSGTSGVDGCISVLIELGAIPRSPGRKHHHRQYARFMS